MATSRGEAFLTDREGGEVVSRLDRASLDTLASTTGGAFLATFEHATPLEEQESGARGFGFTGGKVNRYKEGLLRIEKPGFQTVERRILFREGEMELKVRLPKAREPETSAPDPVE